MRRIEQRFLALCCTSNFSICSTFSRSSGFGWSRLNCAISSALGLVSFPPLTLAWHVFINFSVIVGLRRATA